MWANVDPVDFSEAFHITSAFFNVCSALLVCRCLWYMSHSAASRRMNSGSPTPNPTAKVLLSKLDFR